MFSSPVFSTLTIILLVACTWADVSVTTTSGVVSTTATDASLTIFRGIPFGVAPRFARATLAPYSQTIVTASSYGPSCVQPNGASYFGVEDCLSINIWTPTSFLNSNKTAAVFVWIYGGGFIGGRTSDPLFDLTRIATFSQDVVFVSFNYRVGPFGFLAIDRSLTNLGITDQILGLQWVQQNIKNFGGDSTQVTVMGQSAGSISVCLLLNSPLATGLFRAVVLDEGSCGLAPQFSAQQKSTQVFVDAVGCSAGDVMNCLLGKNISEIMTANFNVGGASLFQKYATSLWLPSVDGFVVPTLPLLQMAKGQVPNRVTVLIGTTTGSMTVFMARLPDLRPSNTSELAALITLHNNDYLAEGYYDAAGLDAIKAYYLNLDNFNGDVLNAAAAYLSDSNFVCGTWREVDLLSDSGMLTYFWVFNTTTPCFRLWGSTSCAPFPSWIGAFHQLDVGFWFNNTESFGQFDADLRVAMMGSLRSFIKTLNPNPLALLQPNTWTPQDSSDRTSYAQPTPLLLQNPLSMAPSFQQQQCALWNAALKSELRNQIAGYGKPPALSRFATIGIVIVTLFGIALFSTVAYFAFQNQRLLANTEFMLQESNQPMKSDDQAPSMSFMRDQA